LVEPAASDLEVAWTAYARGEAGSAGIVDHVSFVVMRRLGIIDAFTNDRHFRAAGFDTLF
jgi:predicted nucleic acid-binding protein